MAELIESDPKNFGEWVVVSKIGAGGQGTVYGVRKKDEDPPAEHCCVAKTLNTERGSTDQGKERFRYELEALQRLAPLKHRGIVRLIDHDLDHDPPYYITEFCEHGDLDEWLERWKRSIHEMLECVIQVCEAASAAHSAGVIHRDIKPENILFKGKPQHPVLIDFGICYQDDRAEDRLTKSLEKVGTTDFIAPELLPGRGDSALLARFFTT